MSYNKTNILYDELYKNRNNILDDIFYVLDVSKSISDDEIIKIDNTYTLKKYWMIRKFILQKKIMNLMKKYKWCKLREWQD